MHIVVLDSGPLGLATNPKSTSNSVACASWLQSLLDSGHCVIIPAIADYEVRRELVRAGKQRGIARLDAASELAEFLPLSTIALKLAAELWARARQQGAKTADDKSLDGDVILAAQALTLDVPTGEFVIATDNIIHLSRFAPAARWQDI